MFIFGLQPRTAHHLTTANIIKTVDIVTVFLQPSLCAFFRHCCHWQQCSVGSYVSYICKCDLFQEFLPICLSPQCLHCRVTKVMYCAVQFLCIKLEILLDRTYLFGR